MLKPNHVALMLSIFASTAHMLSAHAGYANSIFINQQNATRCAFIWGNSALDALEHSSRSTQGSVSVEDIQATIILSFVVFNLEGFTTRFRALTSRAVTMARDLSLHRLDADTHKQDDSLAGLEINRRIWWHIASTDW